MVRPFAYALLTLAALAAGHARALAQPPGTAAVAPETLEQGCILIVQDRSALVGVKEMFLGSNQNNWSPSDPAYKLQPRSDQRWQIVLPKQPGTMDFKVTRGTWDTVEVNKDLSDLVNRRLAPIDPAKLKPGEQPVIELVVEKWADQRPDAQARKAIDAYHELKVTGDVRRLQVPGGGGISLVRDLLVWLPPGYDAPENAGRSYPVLYMQDGQNLFEQLPGVPGEWRVDETTTELVGAGKVEPLIIVGIPHAGPFRNPEYATQPFKGVRPHGDEYVAWLVERVIPRVRGAFRVREGREHTGIGGSSLGALVALHAALRRPEVFGKVLAESPALVFDGKPVVAEELSGMKLPPLRVAVAIGAHEVSKNPADQPRNLEHVHAVKMLAKALGEKLPPDAFRVDIDAEGEHTESTWARRFPAALEFLFPAKPGSAPPRQ